MMDPGIRTIEAPSPISDDQEWAERCKYWLKSTGPTPQRFIERAGVRQPLILTGHGVRLRVDHGTLVVQDGFTHYPQKRETWRFFPGEWRLPSRIVVVDVDGGVTFDALAWLSQQGVPLIQINWRGEVVNVIGFDATAAIPGKVKSQLAARTKDDGLQFALGLIREKIANSIETLRHAIPRSSAVKAAIEKLTQELQSMKRNPPSNVGRLGGIEGRVAYTYFDSWRSCAIRWKGIERKPIPEDWHQVGRRSSKMGSTAKPNRNATHPVNAMLNYAYAILESQVRMQVVAAGLDPAIGILHGTYRGKHALVYDLMEPQRPIVDRKVLEFVQSQTFHPADFTIRADGVCRLNPELSKHLVNLLSNDPKLDIGREDGDTIAIAQRGLTNRRGHNVGARRVSAWSHW